MCISLSGTLLELSLCVDGSLSKRNMCFRVQCNCLQCCASSSSGFKDWKTVKALEVEFGVAVLTCKSCLAASAPALVLKVTKPTGCKERNSHELSLLDIIYSTTIVQCLMKSLRSITEQDVNLIMTAFEKIIWPKHA